MRVQIFLYFLRGLLAASKSALVFLKRRNGIFEAAQGRVAFRLKSSIKCIRQQSLQKGKDTHHNGDFQPVLFCRKFETGLLITESADVIVDEILE
jgi:hypothetical protein